jgi:YD repeat-containing protein
MELAKVNFEPVVQPPPAPDAPQGLEVVFSTVSVAPEVGAEAVTLLRWNAAPGAVSYGIHASTGKDGPYVRIGGTADSTDTAAFFVHVWSVPYRFFKVTTIDTAQESELSSLARHVSADTMESFFSDSGDLIEYFTYEYDPPRFIPARVLERADRYDSTSQYSFSRDYTNDADGRLTKVTKVITTEAQYEYTSEGKIQRIYGPGRDEFYSTDEYGRVDTVALRDSNGLDIGVRVMDYDASGWLVRVDRYDAGGSADGYRALTYNGDGRLVEDATYDAAGAKVRHTTLQYDTEGMLVGATAYESNAATDVVTFVYTQGLITRVEAGGGRSWYRLLKYKTW